MPARAALSLSLIDEADRLGGWCVCVCGRGWIFFFFFDGVSENQPYTLFVVGLLIPCCVLPRALLFSVEGFILGGLYWTR